MTLQQFIGQARAAAVLTALAANEDEHPAPLLISGPAGTGRRVAARLMLEGWRSDTERLMDFSGLRLTMADRPDEGKASVSEIQQILSRKAVGRRAILIELDGCSREVQNALLKGFEEPPAHTWIVAVAGEDVAVLPTLRSRCHRVMFNALSLDELRLIADRDGIDVSDGQLARCSGSVPRLQWLADRPQADDAVASGDVAATVQAVYAEEDRHTAATTLLRAWAVQHPSSAQACQQALRTLRGGCRPESALALGLIG